MLFLDKLKILAEAAEKLASVLNMSKEKAYQSNNKKDNSVKIPEGRKISHEKAKEIERLD